MFTSLAASRALGRCQDTPISTLPEDLLRKVQDMVFPRPMRYIEMARIIERESQPLYVRLEFPCGHPTEQSCEVVLRDSGDKTYLAMYTVPQEGKIPRGSLEYRVAGILFLEMFAMMEMHKRETVVNRMAFVARRLDGTYLFHGYCSCERYLGTIFENVTYTPQTEEDKKKEAHVTKHPICSYGIHCLRGICDGNHS
jgi:hypothetical protein